MKRLRVLARRFAEAQLDKIRDLGGVAPEGAPMQLVQGFEAGFRAARAEIAARLRDELGSEAALDTVGFPHKLGEEEV